MGSENTAQEQPLLSAAMKTSDSRLRRFSVESFVVCENQQWCYTYL
jgi:hypothetical protein